VCERGGGSKAGMQGPVGRCGCWQSVQVRARTPWCYTLRKRLVFFFCVFFWRWLLLTPWGGANAMSAAHIKEKERKMGLFTFAPCLPTTTNHPPPLVLFQGHGYILLMFVCSVPSRGTGGAYTQRWICFIQAIKVVFVRPKR